MGLGVGGYCEDDPGAPKCLYSNFELMKMNAASELIFEVAFIENYNACSEKKQILDLSYLWF